MVAAGDFGIREREQIVLLAIEHGWIFKAEQMSRDNGVPDPVVVLVTIDAIGIFPFRFNRSPRNRATEQLQREARCKRFAVCVVSYADLLRSNHAEGWQEDMEDMRRKGGTSVVCINRTGQFLAAVSPEFPAPAHDADRE